MEGSLANVVMLDELKMQEFWLTHEAVAKLRHEAITLEIRNVQSDVRSMLERLDETERSSASSAPVWIQQGMTGIWIGPTYASVPPSMAAGASIPQPGTPNPKRRLRLVRVLQAQAQAQPHPAPLGQIILDPAGATEGVQNAPGQQFRLSALYRVDAGPDEGFPRSRLSIAAGSAGGPAVKLFSTAVARSSTMQSTWKPRQELQA